MAELGFANGVWQVLTNFIAFGLGFLIVLMQWYVLRLPRGLATLYYLWHTVFCIIYFYFSLNNVADATSYYQGAFEQLNSFRPGTTFIVILTSVFAYGLGMSYFGCFLIYNLFGFIGMLAFAAALREVSQNKAKVWQSFVLVLPLLPGVSFWSGMVGKDALSFLSAGLACWAILDIRRRLPAAIIGAIALFLVRPHIAGLLLGAYGLSTLFFLRTGLMQKSILTAFAVVGFVLVAFFTIDFIGLGDVTSTSDVADYIERRQGTNLGGGSSFDLASLSIPMRLFTYAFRPLFFDAPNLLGIAVSFENLLLLILVPFGLYNFAFSKADAPRVAVTFWFLFAMFGWVLLANTTANLGLANRQKWMFLPMLLTIFATYLPVAKTRQVPQRFSRQAPPTHRRSGTRLT
jgi:hypothetical protein